MNQLFSGSICITDLMETMKLGHSSFSKAQNGKVYANILIWQNEEPDKFGNSMSLQLSSTKDMREKEEKVYIGNAKVFDNKKPVSQRDMPSDDWDANIPVRQKTSPQSGLADKHNATDDLPF
jgi:hypothetical protein